jgi:hypothetical protein
MKTDRQTMVVVNSPAKKIREKGGEGERRDLQIPPSLSLSLSLSLSMIKGKERFSD